MKAPIYLLITFFSLSLSLSSCKLESKNEASPIFILSKGDIIKNSKDSIWFLPIVESKAYLLDSIAVGDTLLFKLKINGGFNPLKELSISLSDKDFAELIFLPKDSLDRIFTAQSNYDEGLFAANGKYNFLYFPFRLYAKEATKNLYLKISVLTSASSQFNNSSIKIKTPIVLPQQKEANTTTQTSIQYKETSKN